MPKTIALQSRMHNIAEILRIRGYMVVDMYAAKRPGAKIDAYLYTSYHPDIFTGYTNTAEAADITMGYASMDFDHRTSPLMLNVTGLTAEQAVNMLEHRLAHKERH
ncbi:MAG: YkuS family protein [Negativicutes bacterium]|nr:YkuS family protein [Negativicutes bacterium]